MRTDPRRIERLSGWRQAALSGNQFFRQLHHLLAGLGTGPALDVVVMPAALDFTILASGNADAGIVRVVFRVGRQQVGVGITNGLHLVHLTGTVGQFYITFLE